MTIHMNLNENSYDIIVSRGLLGKAGEYLNLDRRVLIVTDSGVPEIYAQTLAKQCKSPVIFTLQAGEASKSLDMFGRLLHTMLENNFSRKDCVVAVGGGVVGDLSGFAASAYMRGVDFYNIPTTVLSEVDSSIGGKTAIDFMGLKNIVGAFYPPMGVLIDPDTLFTLPKRQISNGLAEALKMSMTNDPVLFDIFENKDIMENIDTIIERSLYIKKNVVEQDEKETGLRKILNFGHTLAHAIESVNDLETYYHGECVSIGMVPMCSPDVRQRLIPILKKLELPTETEYSADELIDACRHDKKASGDDITIVYVSEIGKTELRKMPFGEYEKMIKKVLG